MRLERPTAAQEVATSGINANIKFCGTKPITLAVLDGYGVNSWSASRMRPFVPRLRSARTSK